MRRANLKTKIMNEAEKLLEKFARKNMIEWNQESFKKSHSKLHKSIIEAINEALRIHDVVGQSEQLPYSIYEEELNKMKQLPQTQTSLMKQCEVLRIFANKLGLYDAADFLRNDR